MSHNYDFNGLVARPLTGGLTILFMLLSVASQLPARAACMSDAALRGLERDDPLAEVLDRAGGPQDERK